MFVRTGLVAFLVLVAVAAAALCVGARWGRDTVQDPDRFVAVVGPLADDPAVQAEVTDRVTAAVMDSVHLSASVEAAMTPVVRETMAQYVRTDSFKAIWAQAARQTQQQVVQALSGTSDGAVTIDISAVWGAVKQELVAKGLTVASSLPDVHADVTLAKSAKLAKAQRLYDGVKGAPGVLLVVAIGAAACAVALARRRLATLVVVAVLAVGAVLVTQVVLAKQGDAWVTRQLASLVTGSVG